MASTAAYCIACYSQLSLADPSPETRAFLLASQFNESIIQTGRSCFKCGSVGVVLYYDTSKPSTYEQSASCDATL
jgi:hypothetical protein